MIRTENTLPHAHMWWGFNASSTGTRLLSLSTIADAKISNPPWVNFQSAGWVSFQSAPTAMVSIVLNELVHSRKDRVESIGDLFFAVVSMSGKRGDDDRNG
ncbi:MAG TPA: hypothetical protein VJN01_04375, partial [Xanthomonadales bacterium]|nr:hypothetical protein [Xanthomonadales bacterium]